jgi:hypothetical protein
MITFAHSKFLNNFRHLPTTRSKVINSASLITFAFARRPDRSHPAGIALRRFHGFDLDEAVEILKPAHAARSRFFIRSAYVRAV